MYDAEPRTISNLIVDSTTANPAAAEAAESHDGAVTDPDTGEVFLPNIRPDEGLSAPTNLFFVLFGQFFDHGLDQVSKGGNGAIIVPLAEDDPLYASTPPELRFMMLNRATNQPNGDREHENRTTPFVDQNQTYTSHPSHHVFLREYESSPAGPVATGRLLSGEDTNGDGLGDGLATWNDVKTQARDVLGIDLVDEDVLAVPQVAVDLYGNFAPGPDRGMPQLMTEDGLVEGNDSAPVDTSSAINLDQAFLDDIAHGAVPVPEDPANPELAGYDNVLLGEHFISGDGRGNENIGLTSVHHVFHAEHNRLVTQINATLNAEGNEDLLAAYQDQSESDDWSYNERVFQSARFANEMQYQHLVFEEFARTIQPTIDTVVFNENSYDSTIDPSIKAEFAHVVYRFGHSMLTQDLNREGFGTTNTSLLDGFLNPVAFHCAVPPVTEVVDGTPVSVCPDGQSLNSEEAAGALINGTTNQTANQIDELMTSTLRNNLLGLPLDLATVNIMRSRDVGVPGLQEARRTFFAESGDPNLEPYTSWEDYGLALRNGENFGRGDSKAALVNFVAAYGTHPTVVDAVTLEDKRAAAEVLVYGIADESSRVERMSGDNRYATAAAVSQSAFPGTAPVVYVASGLGFADALAGGPAAAVEGAPLLLVGTNSIPSATATELNRLQPEEIVVLGGSGVITNQVVESLATYTTTETATRISGDNRFLTATAVSQRAFPTGASTAYIANGFDFPDALAGGAAAASAGAPLLLVSDTSIPSATADELTRLGVTDIKVLGGPNSVSATTLTALGDFGTTERLAGVNRYETAVSISENSFPASTGGTLYLASGMSFPDALTAAPVAGTSDSPVLLVPGNSATIPASVIDEILRLNPSRVVVLGGETSMIPDLMAAVEALFPSAEAPADGVAFMTSAAGSEWANVDGLTTTGLEEVDFWVGGLAEAVEPFGGMLGATFNYVFENQLEDLQFGDRFYYLFRNQGNTLFQSLEANSFSSLIQRNTDASLLPAEIFVVQDPTIDLENLPDPLPAGLIFTGGQWRWDGDEHIEIHGVRTEADNIRGGQGDDALWGYGGNDRIIGGSGNDSIVGGTGDDILTDTFGDDNIKGQQGNDAIDGGAGIDLLLPGPGDDFIRKTQDNADGATGFFGPGDDVFLGGTGRDAPFGNEGDDWLETGPHADLLIADNGQQFQNDLMGGDDVLIGGPGSDDYDAEGGDDILVGSPGSTDRFHGMFGWDSVTYYGTTSGVDADLNFNLLQPPDITAIRDRFTQVEALSGGSGDDVLRGLGVPADDLLDGDVNLLTEDGIDLIGGLEELLRPGAEDYSQRFMVFDADNDGNADLLLGGPEMT
ncbi:cell wall-binding repeat-containing protein [Ornithinimicrobium sp. INDO-MA30-4]|uniref:cell wall-binding repeat-containing protein n=1 Tax=Ornithinimicrobium sp. INDO-MA30-4 TaxID=2908651 RepID=UPI001F49164C|nr:cell wall-binding repeat-containing protein [Ornithinimicrobium sp. INDO-MA30-4]UJH70034.1 cell wall-binding repeat-containing protein [Ornithinimicrobium sp. INDO-MA30-4]